MQVMNNLECFLTEIMKKLIDLLRVKPAKGDFGIEIEVEGKDLVPLEDGVWSTHDDGSLRGRFPESRAEYVLSKPLLRKDVRKSLENLSNHLKDSVLNFSFRTSVHIHVNVQQLTFPQYLNMIYTYLLLEEPFLNYCGKERKGNRFCLRLQDAEGLLDALNRVFAVEQVGIPQLGAVANDNIRYASINLGATKAYGSLEFRAMRGNLDVDVIDTWVEALSRVREFAMQKDDPAAIFKEYAGLGPKGFMQSVLGEYAVVFSYPRMVKDIQRSFSLSFDLPYAYSASYEEYKRREEDQKKYAEALENAGKEAGALDADRYKLLMAKYGEFLALGFKPVEAERLARLEIKQQIVINGELARAGALPPPPVRAKPAKIRGNVVDVAFEEDLGN